VTEFDEAMFSALVAMVTAYQDGTSKSTFLDETEY